MNERHHRFRLLFMSSLLVAFSISATLAIIVWLPIFPEAVAVTSKQDAMSWSEYVSWHQSWRYGSGDEAHSCPE